MRNGWTGGQYSVYRALLATYLLVHFVSLLPFGAELFSSEGVLTPASASPLAHLFPNVLSVFDPPWLVVALIAAGALLTIPLAMGAFDRVAAIAIWYVWACLFGRNPLISNPSLPFVGFLLLAHALVPKAPYGSWKARGRLDPGGGWELPKEIFLAAWIVMALGYTYSGATKLVSPSWMDGTALSQVLVNPLSRPGLVRDILLLVPAPLLRFATWAGLALELLFAPVALFRALRPWVWLAMVGLHLGLLLVVDFADLTIGMLLLHLFTFDPAWIRPLATASPEVLFYDGHCGLCHRIVRFALSEDRSGTAFRFAPLQGEAFRRAVPEATRRALPDSLVVVTAEGRVLVRSDAALHTLVRIGGMWRVLAVLARAAPRFVRDRIYDGIAAVRHRLFRRPDEVCPVFPPALRSRFDPD